MRTLFGFLAASTALSVLWTLFLLVMYPVGVADSLFVNVRPQLAEHVPFEKATALTGQVSHQMTGNVKSVILLVGVPLVVVNAGWALFAGCLLVRGTRPQNPGAPARSV
jgi:hypothetical protein